jgi:hypothetical protein
MLLVKKIGQGCHRAQSTVSSGPLQITDNSFVGEPIVFPDFGLTNKISKSDISFVGAQTLV